MSDDTLTAAKRALFPAVSDSLALSHSGILMPALVLFVWGRATLKPTVDSSYAATAAAGPLKSLPGMFHDARVKLARCGRAKPPFPWPSSTSNNHCSSTAAATQATSLAPPGASPQPLKRWSADFQGINPGVSSANVNACGALGKCAVDSPRSARPRLAAALKSVGVSRPASPNRYAFPATIGDMSSVRGRSHRTFPDGEPMALLQGRVRPATRQKANAAADAAGITLAAYLEALVNRDEVDSNGCPLWLQPRVLEQEELPLKTA